MDSLGFIKKGLCFDNLSDIDIKNAVTAIVCSSKENPTLAFFEFKFLNALVATSKKT